MSGAPKQDHTPTPWRVANGKGVASVKGPDCAIYLNVRTVETDDCVARWQADARLIVEAVNAHASLVAALKTPWLIKNVESHVYWAANGHGYTADVDAAGRYSTEEALIHVRARTVTATVGVVKPFEAPAEVMIPSPEFLAALAGAQKGERRD